MGDITQVGVSGYDRAADGPSTWHRSTRRSTSGSSTICCGWALTGLTDIHQVGRSLERMSKMGTMERGRPASVGRSLEFKAEVVALGASAGETAPACRT